MGAAAAWRLAMQGRHVVVLEQFGPGHERGSSHGGSRIFRYAYPDPEYVALARRARVMWDELASEAHTTVVDVTGGVDHGDPAAVDAVIGALVAARVAHERWPAAEAEERFPGLRFDGDVCFQADAGRCRAATAVAAFARCAASRGAEFRHGTTVTAIESVADGARVRTAIETLDADAVVVAAGAWVAPLIGLAPVRVTQEQYVHFAPRDATTAWPSFIHHRDPVPAYGLETPGEGVKLGAHHAGVELTDLDHRNREPDPAATAALEAYARDWLPGVDPHAQSASTCLYTSTPGEDFVLDRAGAVVVCSPCSGHGFKFAPVIGEIVADLVAGADAPARFRLATRDLRVAVAR